MILQGSMVADPSSNVCHISHSLFTHTAQYFPRMPDTIRQCSLLPLTADCAVSLFLSRCPPPSSVSLSLSLSLSTSLALLNVNQISARLTLQTLWCFMWMHFLSALVGAGCECWLSVSDMSGCDRLLVAKCLSLLKTVSAVRLDSPGFAIVQIFTVWLASAHSFFLVLSSVHSKSPTADVRHHQCSSKPVWRRNKNAKKIFWTGLFFNVFQSVCF